MVARARVVALVLLAGCSGNSNDAALEAIAKNSWAGLVQLDGGAQVDMSGTFAWDATKEILTGQVVIDETDKTHTYSVRRWDTSQTPTVLNLTDLDDPTRGLELSGDAVQAYTGEAVVRYQCDTGTCGWTGQFTLSPSAPIAGGTGGT